MVYNEIMENKYLIYRILIVFVVVTFVTNMAFVALQKNVVSQEKLKAQYTVNSTISRVEIKLESYIEKVGFFHLIRVITKFHQKNSNQTEPVK